MKSGSGPSVEGNLCKEDRGTKNKNRVSLKEKEQTWKMKGKPLKKQSKIRTENKGNAARDMYLATDGEGFSERGGNSRQPWLLNGPKN